MAVEMPEDILEELADRFSIYGHHDDYEPKYGFPFCCRTCFMGEYLPRINEAYMKQRILSEHKFLKDD